MTGIEFLEPADQSAPGAEPGRYGLSEPVPDPTGAPRRNHATGLLWLRAALWSAAAVLAVAAAYQPVLRVSYPGSFAYSVDAWGRYVGGSAAETVRSGARYGPVLCGLGVVFAALAGYCVLRVRLELPAAVRASAAAASMLASGFAAGLVLAMVLQVTSYLDSARGSVHWQAGLGDPVRGDIETAVGASVAFATVALVCAAFAAAAGLPVVRHVVSRARWSHRRSE